MTTFRRAFVTTTLAGLALAAVGMAVLCWPYWKPGKR